MKIKNIKSLEVKALHECIKITTTEVLAVGDIFTIDTFQGQGITVCHRIWKVDQVTRVDNMNVATLIAMEV